MTKTSFQGGPGSIFYASVALACLASLSCEAQMVPGVGNAPPVQDEPIRAEDDTCRRDEPSSTIKTCENAIRLLRSDLTIYKAAWRQKHLELTYSQFQTLLLATEKQLTEAYATIARLKRQSLLTPRDQSDAVSRYLRPVSAADNHLGRPIYLVVGSYRSVYVLYADGSRFSAEPAAFVSVAGSLRSFTKPVKM